MILAMSQTALANTGRTTAILSIVLLSAAIVIGVLVSRKEGLAGPSGGGLSRLHRAISLVAVALVAVHVLASVLTYSVNGRKVAAVFVPFISAYKPLWVGLGAIAFDLLVVVTITSLVRQRIGQRTWLAIHWLTYAAWPVAVVHGLGSGLDMHSDWGLVLTWICVACVGIAVAWRVITAVRTAAPGHHAAIVSALGPPATGIPAARDGRAGPPQSPAEAPSETHRTIP
jgi:methionine sulfoxide reductase heme-binding subunit